ncbi:hypothetical protein WDU94_009933 [Cyamophila willieti]
MAVTKVTFIALFVCLVAISMVSAKEDTTTGASTTTGNHTGKTTKGDHTGSTTKGDHTGSTTKGHKHNHDSTTQGSTTTKK